MGKGSKGRPRKIGKREPNGRPQRDDAQTRREADRVEPTPEMAAHKAQAQGGEVGNPLSYIPGLSDPQREALERYFSLRRAAGWGVKRTTARYDDPVTAGADEQDREEQERKTQAFYSACDRALMEAGKDAHRAVANLFSFRQLLGSLSDLQAGANALARFFRIDMRDAA